MQLKIEPAMYMRVPYQPVQTPVAESAQKKYHETATITETIAHLRADNFDFATTALRRCVISGAIPSVRCGNKYLIYYPHVIAYLTGSSK